MKIKPDDLDYGMLLYSSFYETYYLLAVKLIEGRHYGADWWFAFTWQNGETFEQHTTTENHEGFFSNLEFIGHWDFQENKLKEN